MTVWFADASVLLSREDADDDQHRAARRLLAGDVPVATLDLAYYEVSNVAVRAWRDPDAARRLRGLVRALADDGGLLVSMMRSWGRRPSSRIATVCRSATPPTSSARERLAPSSSAAISETS